MILCDTDVLIEFYKKTPHILKELECVGYTQISISAITQGELYFGALNKSELGKIKQHLSLITRFPVTKAITFQYLDLMEKF